MAGSTDTNVDYAKLGMNVMITAITHPKKQATILMQLGHEPGQTVHKRSMALFGFGGTLNAYRSGILTGYLTEAAILDKNLMPTKNITAGMGMAICDVVSSSLTQTAVTETVNAQIPKNEDDTSYNEVLKDVLRETAIKSCGVIVARPFHVLSVRQVAALAGDPQLPLLELVKNGGIYSGIVPHLLYEAGNIFITKTLMHLYVQNKKEIGEYLGSEDSKDTYIEMIVNLATSAFLYPLKLVSTIQALSGTGMALDAFPELSWLTIYFDLSRNGEANRGASTLFSRKVKLPTKAIEAPKVVEEPVIVNVVEEVSPPVTIPIPSSIPESNDEQQEQKE